MQRSFDENADVGWAGGARVVGRTGGAATASRSASDALRRGDVQFVCGQQAPEDLVVLPGSQWVVASAFGGSGGVYLIRVS